MKLSMQNLADWLENHQYSIHCKIHTDSAPVLENVHWLSENMSSPEIVYVEPYSEFSGTHFYTTIANMDNEIIRIANQEPGVVFNLLLSVFLYYNDWERRLLSCILNKKGVQAMCDIGDEVFQSPMIICGNDGQTFAITSGYSPDISPVWKARLNNDSISFDTIQQYMSTDYFRQLRRNTYRPSLNDSPIWNGRTLNTNLYYRGQRKGFIVAYQYQHILRQGDIHLMNIFARLIEQYLAMEPDRYFSFTYLEHFLYSVIKGSDADFHKLDIIFRYNGWKWNDHFFIVCMVPLHKTPDSERLMEKIQTYLSGQYSHICSFIADGILTMLVNQTASDHEQELLTFLRENTSGSMKLCRSLDFYDIHQFQPYYSQTIHILLNDPSMDHTYLCVKDHIASIVKAKLSENPYARSFIHPAFRILGNYDKENNSDLIQTLKAYLLHSCNTTDTAQALNIHRNTLIHRINKIENIIHLNLSSDKTVEMLQFAVLFL